MLPDTAPKEGSTQDVIGLWALFGNLYGFRMLDRYITQQLEFSAIQITKSRRNNSTVLEGDNKRRR